MEILMAIPKVMESLIYSNPHMDDTWSSKIGRTLKAGLGAAATAGLVWYTKQDAIVTLAAAGVGCLRNAIMRKAFYGDQDKIPTASRTLEEGTLKPAFTGAYLFGALLMSYNAYKVVSAAADMQTAALNFAKSYSGASLLANVFVVTPFKGRSGEDRIGGLVDWNAKPANK
jgi:hypothetical protein